MGQEGVLIFSAITIFSFISMLLYSIYRIKRIETALISVRR